MYAMDSSKKIIILGAGFSSLSAACYLAKKGFQVTILEKNKTTGGRARQFKKAGFTFDMGPTFYWMPDVFEKFFNDFGKKPSDYYKLQKLNPAYKVYFEDTFSVEIPDNFKAIKAIFENIEKGSAEKLEKFIKKAGENYKLAIGNLVYQPGEKLKELLTFQTAKKIKLFVENIKNITKRHFKNPYLRQIVEFPVLFLGAKPEKTPAFYNFMNYADFCLGTWHPVGGMYKVVEAMETLAKSLGVEIKTGSEVLKFITEKNTIKAIETSEKKYEANIFLSGADYAHTEKLLPLKMRQYSEKYWKKRTFAPSALLFYVGFEKEIENVSHHTLFFDTDFAQHAKAIYDVPKYPENPLFYVSFPSKTDKSFAPKGKESAIFLIPLATNLEDTSKIRQYYFEKVIRRLEKNTRQKLKKQILFWESFSINDFVKEYHSYGGNAYGLANTLFQTHYFRPKIKSKKLKNLYFCGQLTVPGPGVPPSIISGKIASKMILKHILK